MARPDNDEDLRRRQRARNLTLAAALIAFVAVVYLVSIVRMGGG